MIARFREMDSHEFTFKKPNYIKVKNQSGTYDPCYQFIIHTAESLCAISDREEFKTDDMFLGYLVRENQAWYRELLAAYLQSSSQYFAKSYNADTISRFMSHRLVYNDTAPTEGATSIRFTPQEILILQGKFTLVWKVAYEPILIDIPECAEETTMVSTVPAPEENKSEDIRTVQVNPTELEMVEDIVCENEMDAFQLKDTSRHYEKQRVREAQLRARLAQYKAERAISRYMEKYGDQISDSDWMTDGEDSE